MTERFTKKFPKGFKTPNGSDWPMNYYDNTQEEMNYAWRSKGSWMPPEVAQRRKDRDEGKTTRGPAVDPAYVAIFKCGDETNHTECHIRHPESDVRGKQS